MPSTNIASLNQGGANIRGGLPDPIYGSSGDRVTRLDCPVRLDSHSYVCNCYSLMCWSDGMDLKRELVRQAHQAQVETRL
jgi:hypothetical protein